MAIFDSLKEKMERLPDNFDKIVRENYRNVYSLALRIVGNEADAEDITQEVFMKFYKSSEVFRGDSKTSTLLYKITYNHSIDFTRKRKIPKMELNEETTQILDSESERTIEREEQFEQLERAISLLPIEEQTIITLFYIEEKSVEEVSKIVSLSIANTKVKLHRIRKKLQGLTN